VVSLRTGPEPDRTPKPEVGYGHCDWTDVPPEDVPEPAADLPEGTRVHLQAGEWFWQVGIPATTYLDLRVVRVEEPIRGVAWVRAHLLECHWGSMEPHAPCQDVLVKVEVLSQAAAQL
jgi:hypothetical protein